MDRYTNGHTDGYAAVTHGICTYLTPICSTLLFLFLFGGFLGDVLPPVIALFQEKGEALTHQLVEAICGGKSVSMPVLA